VVVHYWAWLHQLLPFYQHNVQGSRPIISDAERSGKIGGGRPTTMEAEATAAIEEDPLESTLDSTALDVQSHKLAEKFEVGVTSRRVCVCACVCVYVNDSETKIVMIVCV
jgi:hypothetical protein